MFLTTQVQHISHLIILYITIVTIFYGLTFLKFLIIIIYLNHFYVFNSNCFKGLGNFEFYTKSLFPLKFSIIFCMLLIERLNLNLNYRSDKKRNSVVVSLVLTFTLNCSIYITKLIHCYKFLNYCLYIFEDIIDIKLFL